MKATKFLDQEHTILEHICLWVNWTKNGVLTNQFKQKKPLGLKLEAILLVLLSIIHLTDIKI